MDNRKIENRPSYQFLLAIKNIIKESEPVLKAYSWHYRTARIKLDILRSAIRDIEAAIVKAEEERPYFVCDPLLIKNCAASAERVNDLDIMLAEVRDDISLKRWQAELARLASLIHFKKIENMQTNDIDVFRTLRIADKRLIELKAQAKKTGLGCIPTQTKREFERRVGLQEAVINQLEQELEDRKSTPEIDRLKAQYDELRMEVQYQIEHKDDIIKQASMNLDNARTAHEVAAGKITNAESAYYANISAQHMHGLLRINERFKLFSTTLKSNIKNKDEIGAYLDRLDSMKSELDTMLSRLWCDHGGKLTAKEIDWHLNKLDPAEKEKFLLQPPDSKALSQIYKKGITESTAEKRSHLKRANEGVNGRVIFKM